eukprot:560932_1
MANIVYQWANNIMNGFYGNTNINIMHQSSNTMAIEPLHLDHMLYLDLDAQNHSMITMGINAPKLPANPSTMHSQYDLVISAEPKCLLPSDKKVSEKSDVNVIQKKINCECINNGNDIYISDDNYNYEIESELCIFETISTCDGSDYDISSMISDESCGT